MNGLQISAKEKDYADNVVTVLALFVQSVGIIQREVEKMAKRELKTKSFKIANEADKNEFFDKMHGIVAHAIFEELIKKQHHHLNITINIEAVEDGKID